MSTAFKNPKDPDAILDYTANWATWLDGDTISTSTWTVPSGITKVTDSNTTTTATIWLSGGTAGEKYEIKNTITTAGGRKDERTFKLTVKDNL